MKRLMAGTMMAALLAAWGGQAKAQTPSSDAPQPAPSGMLIPVGVVPMLGEAQWSLTGQLRETLDDNILMSPTAQQSDAMTAVVFNLGGAWVNRRLSWDFQYIPDFSLYASHSRYNDLAQAFAQGLAFRWTNHTTVSWNLIAHRYPGRSAIPGLSFGLGGVAAGASTGLQQGAIISGGRQSLDLTHELSRHSRYSLDLSAGLEHYGKDPAVPVTGGVMFGNSRSWGISGGWSHDLTRHLSMGVQSDVNQFQSSGVGAATRYASLESTWTWRLTPATSVSMGAGPSWMQTGGQRWGSGYAASFALSHSSGHSTLALSWNRTMQLAQIQAGLQSDSWGGNYQYQAGSWNWGASLAQARSAVGAAGQPTRNRSLMVYTGYRIAPAWIAKASYSHGAQTTPALALAGLRYARNQWAFEIDHIFAGGAHAQAGH